MGVLIVWLKFFICSCVLIIASYKLCKYGDYISSRFNLSRLFIGAILLATATSLPEFVTSLGAIVSVGSIDLAVGDVLGTLVINLMIIVILDIIQGEGPIMYKARSTHILYAGMTVILLASIIFGFIARTQLKEGFMFFNMGIESIFIVVIYLISLWLVFSYEKKGPQEQSVKSPSQKKGLVVSVVGFLFYFLVVVIAGVWLANIGNQIVEVMDWSGALVGSIFLAIATSFPEMIVSISALRMGSINMAIGNILGSNLFDIMIIPLCDLFWVEKSLFASIAYIHLILISMAIIMTGIVIVSIIYRSRKAILKMGWDVVAMIAVFIIGYMFLWIMGR
ncbi:MAG: hypothetical protein KJ952_05860 [Candidatus Omnitrophica bacterium]|nr:hypothetical protein [Candidatus Omnitrophota bacterium]